MTGHNTADYPSDRRSESRQPSNRFHSVELKLSTLPIYLFKIKDISSNGACFMVKEGSAILKHLKVGQILSMRYHAEDEKEPSEVFKSEIKYIEKADEGPFKGHYGVGILLLKRQNESEFEGIIE